MSIAAAKSLVHDTCSRLKVIIEKYSQSKLNVQATVKLEGIT